MICYVTYQLTICHKFNDLNLTYEISVVFFFLLTFIMIIHLLIAGYDINTNLQTGLPQGTYCDIISGNLENGRCTGSTVHVGGDGHAHFNVCSGCDDPMVAIHVGECRSKGFLKKI